MITPERVSAIIVSAGLGKRFGGPKHDALLGGRPILDWSLQAFQECEQINALVLVLHDPENSASWISRFPKLLAVTAGGKERQDSVRAGFQALPEPENCREIVLVHDAARPLVSGELIRNVIQGARNFGAAVPVVPVPDTLKEVFQEKIQATLDRTRYYRSQTPQGFQYAWLKAALQDAEHAGFSGTDESLLVERLGKKPAAVPGQPTNLKITTPLDLKIAEACLDL
jgi:2-C-methyl-D-erythritol 4-phosphate cytidylyltransferase